MRVRRGFTLMEMLIVTAILGILTAVSIPVFASRLEAVRAAACAANIRSLKAVLSTAYLTDGTDIRTNFDAQVKTGEFPCPDHGVYTLHTEDGVSFTITCSKHDGGDFSQDPTKNFTDVMSALQAAFKNGIKDETGKTINVWNGGTHRIDSNAPDGVWTTYIAKQFADEGVDVSSIGYWAVLQNGSASGGVTTTNWVSYLWTESDLDSVAVGQTVPVIRYDATAQRYYVKKETVQQSKTGGTYHVLSPGKENEAGGYKTTGMTAYPTYAEALAAYKALT